MPHASLPRRIPRSGLAAGLALTLVLSAGTRVATAAELLASSPDDAPGAAWQTFVSGATSAFTRESGALRLALAGGDRASCALAVPPGARNAMLCRFNLTLSGAAALHGNAFVLRVGSGFSAANVDDSNLATYARLGVVGAESGNGFRLRDCESGSTSTVFEGTQAVTWAVNRSGHAMTYAAPDGSSESIASGRMDVWVGRRRVLDERSVTNSTVAMTDVKSYWNGVAGSTALDGFDITPLDADARAVAVAEPVAPAPEVDAATTGSELELYHPTPNPFEHTTRFAYAISAGTEQVDIGVFDLAGRRIRVLAHGTRGVGRYEVAWDGRSDGGERVRNGVYFLRASMGTDLRVARITYLVK
jgi:hypothetical protein